MNHRSFVIFLIINFFIACGIIFYFNNSFKQSKKLFQENTILSKTKEENKINQVEKNLRKIDNIQFNNKDNNVESVNAIQPAICMQYGPLNAEQIKSLSNAINKENIYQNNLYEVYWSLGIDKSQAEQTFSILKKSILKDPKFKLLDEDGTWVVSIVTIDGDIETAKSIVKELGEKAKKVNAGGKWYYQTLPPNYYYTIKDINLIDSSILEKLVGFNKTLC